MTPTSPTDGCPSHERLSEIAEGRVSRETDPATHRHLQTCAICREEVELARTFHEDTAPADPEALDYVMRRTDQVIADLTTSKTRGRRLIRGLFLTGVTISAAATVLLLVDWPGNRPDVDIPAIGSETMRGRQIELVSPDSAEVANAPPQSFVWEPIPDADHYRIRVWTRAGELVLDENSQEATLEFPPGVLRPATRYIWQITAIDGSQVECARSGKSEFSIPINPPGEASRLREHSGQ